MDSNKAIDLINKYAVCPKCQNSLVGDGEGTLEIDKNTFIRSCKCGFIVKIKITIIFCK